MKYDVTVNRSSTSESFTPEQGKYYILREDWGVFAYAGDVVGFTYPGRDGFRMFLVRRPGKTWTFHSSSWNRGDRYRDRYPALRELPVGSTFTVTVSK